LSTIVDIKWPLVPRGRIPVHHQYHLLAGISRIVPEIHATSAVGVHLIRGSVAEPGFLELRAASAVALRAPVELLPKLLPLGGKKLDIAGCPIRLGVPQVFALSPAERLWARLVTIKGYMEVPQFEAAVRRKLDTLGVRTSVVPAVGRRRVIRIRSQTIVGFGLRLHGLHDDESIRVQQHGLGGRRHFGCGLFHPDPMEVEAE
jgi:CRISPR-associated protein Cas6